MPAQFNEDVSEEICRALDVKVDDISKFVD